MKNLRTAIIIAAVLIVIITAVVMIFRRTGGDLRITQVNGDVVVTHNDGTAENASAETPLSQGDIITVGSGAECVVRYSINGREEDQIYIEPLAQLFITDEFKGSGSNEIYLNRGAIIVNGMTARSAPVVVRTDSSSITTKGSVIRAACDMTNAPSVKISSLSGASEIQLYNLMGEKVDRDGNIGGKSEPLESGYSIQVMSASGDNDRPTVVSPATAVALSDFGEAALKNMMTISSMGDLVFSKSEIDTVLQPLLLASKPEDSSVTPDSTTSADNDLQLIEPDFDPATLPLPDFEPETETPPEPDTEPDTEDDTEPEPETTTTTVQTTEQTTQRTTVQTTVQTTERTTERATERETEEPAVTEEIDALEYINVYIIIGDEITEQKVPYGGSAIKPADPVIEGRKFVGWDDSFDNITGERMISAIFEDEDELSVNTDFAPVTETVPDTSGTFYEPAPFTETTPVVSLHTVTFIVDGQAYSVSVQDGTSAVPPVIPPMNDSNGQMFFAWDQDFSNVTSDMTVYAVYG
ncbi:MAG: InlB B-repeat-containing protein [Oscillospiraceae bacterium]|nr:InlB B-repeat-containing protein [Oscillospiraceae bacterium]